VLMQRSIDKGAAKDGDNAWARRIVPGGSQHRGGVGKETT